MMWEELPSHWWADLGAMELFILGLATWRLTSMLVNEEGPWNLFVKFRYMIGIRYDVHSERVTTNVLAYLLSCVWCSSVWIGSLVVVLYLNFPKPTFIVLLICSASTIAILIERMVSCD